MNTQPIELTRRQNSRCKPSTTKPNAIQVVGFVRHTRLLTRQGDVAVQHIQPGTHVITRDAGLVQVQAVQRHRVLMRAISIAAGSLGDTRPDSDVILPANQKILIRDWRAQALFGCDQALVPASDLVDGEFICDQGLQRLDLYTLQLDRLHVIYAGGLEVAGAITPEQHLRPAA